MIRRSRAGSNVMRLSASIFMAGTSSSLRAYGRASPIELHVSSETRIAYIRDLCEAGAFPEMEVGEIPVAYGGHLEDR